MQFFLQYFEQLLPEVPNFKWTTVTGILFGAKKEERKKYEYPKTDIESNHTFWK